MHKTNPMLLIDYYKAVHAEMLQPEHDHPIPPVNPAHSRCKIGH